MFGGHGFDVPFFAFSCIVDILLSALFHPLCQFLLCIRICFEPPHIIIHSIRCTRTHMCRPTGSFCYHIPESYPNKQKQGLGKRYSFRHVEHISRVGCCMLLWAACWTLPTRISKIMWQFIMCDWSRVNAWANEKQINGCVLTLAPAIKKQNHKWT